MRKIAAVALVPAIAFVFAISLVLGGTMVLVANHYNLGWYNSRTDSALLLAEAGINDEITYIAQHLGDTAVTSKSSQPTAGVGETEVYPGEGHVVYGRKGTVSGFSSKYFWVYSSMDSAGATAWDGITPNFYVTARAKVDGAWRKVQAQVKGESVFSLYAIVALASYTNNSNAISLSSATATISGTMLTNGQVSNSSSTIVASNAINANTISNNTGQFTASNVANGGTLYSQSAPWVYPSTVEVLKLLKGQTGLSDSAAWTWIGTAANNSNATGIYTYRTTAQNSTISSGNCQLASGVSLGGTPVLQNSTFTGANAKPGTTRSSNNVTISAIGNTTPISITTSSNHGLGTGDSVQITGATPAGVNGQWVVTKTGPKSFTLNGSTALGAGSTGTASPNLVKTIILEPGDYYLSQINISYASTIELIVDPNALASGGTAGQVRIWINDTTNGAQNDTLSIPISGPNGTTLSPDSFRLYYGKDNRGITISRPNSITDYAGNTISADFTLYGGVYCVTKKPGDASSLNGTQITFSGNTSGNTAKIVLNGALVADKVAFQGLCQITYSPSSKTDPLIGTGISGGYTDFP
ncbi:MAG: hypothetical protein JSS65_06650 [Armatimonadetes bacterium]|nr:hypothetical protein [Armatimonadota bacterium]